MILKRLVSGRLVLAALCLGLASAGARALDYNDVVELLQNQVSDSVIINMAKAQPSLYITEEEANYLRAMGASENVIAALNPRPTSIDPAAVTAVPVVPEVSSTTMVSAGPAMPAEGSPVFPVEISVSSPYPPRFEKEGFLSISNRDWQPYYLSINLKDKRMFLSRVPNGGIAIQSGENVVLNIRKEGYKLYGDSGEKLTVKIRDGETTTLSLEPFGVFGNSGLVGVSIDRDNRRREVLFNNYVPTVVVQPPVVVQPAPPPVVVVPAPPPPPRYYYYHRPPHRRYHW